MKSSMDFEEAWCAYTNRMNFGEALCVYKNRRAWLWEPPRWKQRELSRFCLGNCQRIRSFRRTCIYEVLLRNGSLAVNPCNHATRSWHNSALGQLQIVRFECLASHGHGLVRYLIHIGRRLLAVRWKEIYRTDRTPHIPNPSCGLFYD